jgi:nucleoside 2-deoxyribosyltransferase
MKLYLAGPLFTTAEQEFNRQLRDRLESVGHEVWLPQEHEPRERSAQAIFEVDVAGLEGVEVVVANMDGSDPDSGSCWECGYAYKKKPIILFRTDFREAGDVPGSPFNLMLSASAVKVILAPLASVEELARRIASTLAELPVG